MSNLNFFQSVKTVYELKKEYKRLVKIHHPDLGGDLETMKALNNEYERMLKFFDGQEMTDQETGVKHTYKYNEAIERELMEKIFSLLSLRMEGVEIALVGTWVWLSGNTKQYKDSIKELGFFWNGKRSMWYFRKESKKWRGHSKGNFAEIARKYGYQKFESESAFTPASV